MTELPAYGGYKVPTYYPTMQEMRNFSAYVKKIHDEGGNRSGLAKIKPPHDYKPRKVGYSDEELLDLEITSPIRQEVNGERGLYQQLNIVERKKITVRNFKKLAEEKYPTPLHKTSEDLERIFWKNIFTQPSIYGADVSGSLFDDDVEEFNLTRLKTILDDMNEDYGITIQGVNTAYLYFGMWKTSFCWHTEDMDLYSINYLHHGAPKSWYTIPPEHGKRFERLAASFFPLSFKTCKAFLRHKTTMISPAVLKKYSIPFSKCTQEVGEFIITFPFAYHSGYNHGFNIAEATNFALEYWIEFGKWATRCECSTESVRISMQTFVKRYQSDRYENWIQGKDFCEDPRDRRHKAAAPKPTDHDLYIMGSHVRPVENVAPQQNKAKNIKTKTKNKAYPTLAETLQRYKDLFLKPNDQNECENSIHLSHYSPIPEDMVPINYKPDDNRPISIEPYNFLPRNSELLISAISTDKPNYDDELKEWQKKRKKEPKQKPKKEKKSIEPSLPPKDLLQYLPLNFTHEKRFNRCIASNPPYCSVCQLLESHPINEEIWQSGKQVEEFKLPEASRVALPRSVFNPELFNVDEVDGACPVEANRLSFLDMNLETSELFQCSVCMLCVHKTCYGLEDRTQEDWVCDRCLKRETRTSIVCEFCPCRGGALKEIGSNVWVHITCALTVPNMKLTDILKPPDKDNSQLELKLPKSKDQGYCEYCTHSPSLSKYIKGRCVKCAGHYSADDHAWVPCEKTFHPTCGHRNGVMFSFFDSHNDLESETYIRATCVDCKMKQPRNDTKDIEDDDLDPIPTNTEIIARSKDGNNYRGFVESCKNVKYYSVYFPESSEYEAGFIDRDIVGFEPDTTFNLGDRIEIRTRGGTKVGRLTGSFEKVEYIVRFEHAGRVEKEKVRRQHIYLNADQMNDRK